MNRAISTFGMHALLRQNELLEEARRDRLVTNARRQQRRRTYGQVLRMGRRRTTR